MREAIFILVNGKHFHCEKCNHNLFHHAPDNNDIVVCNNCGTEYSDKSDEELFKFPKVEQDEAVERGFFLVTCPLKFDRQFIDDVMVTALEGGISDWAGDIRRKCKPGNIDLDKIDGLSDYYKGKVPMWAYISRGGSLEIYSDGQWLEFRLYHFMSGLQSFLNHKSSCKYVDPTDYLDAGNIDADDADMIVQYGLFGEIVYC